mgnify:FL=1|tara:strand:+ start:653 stop:1693 length:1041 start_codon:yes stop_codon:yes gene_type:complete
MSEEIIEAPAEAPIPAEVTNISAEDYAVQRMERNQEQPKPEAEEAIEEVSESEEVTEESEAESDVLSQFNLDEMSEDQIKELSKVLGSRAVDRFGELTKRAKGAEERLKELEVSISDNPLEPIKEEVENNPFDDISEIEPLREKAKEISDIIEWAEDILFESDDYGPHADVTEVEGKSMTKAEVRSALKNARRSRDTYLPSQLSKIQNQQSATKARAEYGQKAIDEFDWLKEGGDETMKNRFVEIAGSKELQKLYKDSPAIGAKLPYIIAHAVDSMYQRRIITDVKPTGKAPKISPPSSITSSSKSEVSQNRSSKAIKDLGARFKSSGTKDDFITMRTKQLASRLA